MAFDLEAAIEAAVARGIREGLASLRPAEPPTELLPVSKAARLANVSEATIRAWLKEGLLPRYGTARVTRVRREDVLSVREVSEASAKSPEQLVERLMGPRRVR